MSVAFWTCELKAGKPFDFQPPEGYVLNVQQAALVADNKECLRVFVETDSIFDGNKVKSCLCTLRGEATEQCSVAIVFGYDAEVVFSVEGKGKGKVYLSGYLQPGPELDGEEDDYDSYDKFGESGEEDSDSEPESESAEDNKMVIKPDSESGSESGSDDSDDSEDEDFVKKMIEKLQNAAPGESEESDSEDSEEESESEEEPPMKTQKTAPQGKVVNNQKPKTPQSTPQSKPKGTPQQQQNNKPKTPQHGGNKSGASTPKTQNKTPQQGQSGKKRKH